MCCISSELMMMMVKVGIPTFFLQSILRLQMYLLCKCTIESACLDKVFWEDVLSYSTIMTMGWWGSNQKYWDGFPFLFVRWRCQKLMSVDTVFIIIYVKFCLIFFWNFKRDILLNWNIKGTFNGNNKTAGLTLDKTKARILLNEARLNFNNKEFNRKQN